MFGVFEVYTVFEQGYAIYTAGRDRLQKYCRNPELANEFDVLFKRLLDELARLVDKCSDNSVKLPDHDLQFYTVRIEELHQKMKDISDMLQKKTKQLKNPFYRFTRAFTTSDWLSELETSAHRADQLLREITTCFVNADLISRHTEDVTVEIEKHAEELTAAIAKHTETVTSVIVAGSEFGSEREAFGPSFDVPDNPPHVLLNLQSTSGLEQGATHPNIIEANLKAVVLKSKGLPSIGAVGSPLAHVVGTDGMSGVGKSCAMRGLAKDPEIRQRFRHGIYYIILGKDTTEANVVRQVAEIIKASGGTRTAGEVLEEESVDAAVAKARRWFAGKCTLLLMDDACEEKHSGCDVVARLSRLVDMEAGSRVVFTTRDVRIGLRSELIHFSPRDAEVSLQILLSSAGLSAEDVEAFRRIVDDVLEVCGGLPMALAIAGSAIKLGLALQSRFGSTGEEVWASYLSELQTHREYLLRDTVDNDPYQNLGSAFMTSLLMLDKNVTRRLPFEHSMSFSEMYRALIVLQRQGWVPAPVLQRLWDTKDEHETLRVLQELVNANLGRREDRMVNGNKTPGISLHDLHLSFVQNECKRYGESEKWHRKLLEMYLPEESLWPSSVACRPWWKDEVFIDEYIRNNVSRHLVSAGLGRELHALLRNPNWVAKRLCVHEILQLEDDVGMMLELMRSETGPDLQKGSEWCLRMIAGAARLSSPYVSPTEVWFQLYARLMRLAQQSDAIMLQEYVADIARCAKRPWVKALSSCLPEPGGALLSTLLCHRRVSWISEVEDSGKLIACGTMRCEAFVCTFVGGQLEKTVWLSAVDDCAHVGASAGPFGGPTALGNVFAVSCTRDGSRAVTGHADGTVQLWDSEQGKPVGEAFRGHCSSVGSVVLSADGKRIASGSLDGTVRVWNAETGEPVGDSMRGHADRVRCIAFCSDGKLVASGSEDGTVQRWNAETGKPVGYPLRGHSNWVRCVTFSTDGKVMASGSDDATVRLWDAETGQQKGDAWLGHNGWVRCIAFSADGKRLASGSEDSTVRVWDSRTGELLRDALHGHSGRVECVAFCGDGKFVASGSLDNTLRVWDADTGERIDDVACQDSNSVLCIAFSVDGKHVVAGSRDGTAQLWNAETGRPVSNTLRGHISSVGCVAFSADGKRVATGSHDGTVRLWNTETGAPLGDALCGHSDAVGCLAFSANGKFVASGSDDSTVQVWNTETEKLVSEGLRGHDGWVRCVAFSRDGKRLASGSIDRTVRVWNSETGEAVGDSLVGHSDVVRCVAFSGDGKRVASGCIGASVRAWDVDSGRWLQVDNSWTGRDLSQHSFLSRDGVAQAGCHRESRIRLDPACITYSSARETSVLATLESTYVAWEYSEASQIIAAISGNKVHFFKVIV